MVFCVGLVALIAAPNLLDGLRSYDAGIASSAAMFTLHGLLPYRDYWLLYGPLSGLLLAVPTALLGPSVELIRLAGLGLVCVQAGLGFLIARSWASTGPAILIAIVAVVMCPALIGIEPSSWSVAMAFALAAIFLSLSTSRGGLLIGIMTGLTFLARLDVGAYVLLSVLLVRDRRATLLGFGLIAVPFALVALMTTNASSLVEQLIWFPLFGQRQFRGLPGPETIVGQPTAAIMSIPLLLIPRLGIALGILHVVLGRIRNRPLARMREVCALLVFALLCQLQTLQGRADLEHYAQAATPALLLLAVWFRARRPSVPRVGGLIVISLICAGVALINVRYVGSDGRSAHDRAVEATSAWIRQATTSDEPIFVGLTSHRYTMMNPLLIYYLSGRRAGVHDAMFNPGVTNTDWGQARMIDDLERSRTRYLVLDRSWADLHEEVNESRVPGSIHLDTYIDANFHVQCDLVNIVIMARNGADLSPAPACPAVGK